MHFCGPAAGKPEGAGQSRDNKGNAQNAKEGPGGAVALLGACQGTVHPFVQLFLVELRDCEQTNSNKSDGKCALEEKHIQEQGMGVVGMASGSYFKWWPKKALLLIK